MSHEAEVWHPVLGYEGIYSVSSHGRVRGEERHVRSRYGNLRIQHARVLKPKIGHNGYPRVELKADGKTSYRHVHTLVLEAFVGPRSAHAVARHLDGNKLNSVLQNLCWGTRAENAADMVKHGGSTKGERNPFSKLTNSDVVAIRQDARSETEIARDYNVARSTVHSVKKRHTWAHVEN